MGHREPGAKPTTDHRYLPAGRCGRAGTPDLCANHAATFAGTALPPSQLDRCKQLKLVRSVVGSPRPGPALDPQLVRNAAAANRAPAASLSRQA
jgi:hypothetical protein